MSRLSKYFLVGVCFTAFSLDAAVNTGGDSDTLDSAVSTVNAGPDFTLNFNQNVDLISPTQGGNPTQVRALLSDGTFTYLPGTNINVQGNGRTISGSVRGFFIGGRNSTNVGSVTITDLNFSGTTAQGGTGSGGGLGAGGGVFVGQNCVAILDNCSFTNCQALGGPGVNPGPSGGGGMKGSIMGSLIGGGGFGGDSDRGGGGASDFNIGDAPGVVPGNNFDGGGAPGTSGVGGEGIVVANNGGFGGGGGVSPFLGNGGTGEFGGGGGFGQGNGGDGGFGGGGGQGTALGGTGGFGGGNGSLAIGGAGAGFGGAIFMQDGSSLTILNNTTFSGNNVAAGAGGNPNLDPLANFGAAGADIFMMSSSLLTFNINSDVVVPNPIEGNQGHGGGNTATGGLIKQGPALLTLNGYNTYTGPTLVQAGELRIVGANASVVSDITVSLGATLSGNFTANRNEPNTGGGTITNNGTVSPGVGGVGTINLINYVQSASGTFLVDLTPTANVNDAIFLDMTGTANLAGTINVVLNAGNYIAGTQYTVINGTVVPGTQFDNVIKSGSEAANVNIEVTYGSVIVTILSNQLFTSQSINPGIPQDVVHAITGEPIDPNSDFAYVVTVLGTLSNSAVNKALIAMSPVMLGTLEWINARNNSYVASLLDQHLFQLGCSLRNCQDKNSSVWGAAFGNAMNNHEKFDNLTPYTANSVGGVVGYDYCFPHYTFGVAGGYLNTDLHWKGDLGGGDLNSYYGAVYGSYDRDHISVAASLLAGGTDNDTHRKLKFSTIDRTAKGDFWSYFVTGHLGAESDWSCRKATFTPFALVDYHYYDRNRVKERGADSIDLDIRARKQNMIRGEAGVKAYYTISKENSCYAPYIALSWVGEFPIETSHQKANFVGRFPTMNVKSYDSSQQLISPQAGFKATAGKGFSFILGYKGLFNDKTSINEGEGRLEWVF